VCDEDLALGRRPPPPASRAATDRCATTIWLLAEGCRSALARDSDLAGAIAGKPDCYEEITLLQKQQKTPKRLLS
jgi:hypothetical protein